MLIRGYHALAMLNYRATLLMLQQKIIYFTTYYTSHYNTTWPCLFDAIMGITCIWYITYTIFGSTFTTIICYCYYILHTCLQYNPTPSFLFFYKYNCSHVLIQYGPTHWLKGAEYTITMTNELYWSEFSISYLHASNTMTLYTRLTPLDSGYLFHQISM
jgi:hypothetical protein